MAAGVRARVALCDSPRSGLVAGPPPRGSTGTSSYRWTPATSARCSRGAARRGRGTSDLLFKPAQIVSYASQAITLRPGDLIATGTPGGVGDARKPPVYLQPGNVLRTWIEGLGQCLNHCVPEKTG
jgi:Fumarylacetoacetate (FAA) hydrolase family